VHGVEGEKSVVEESVSESSIPPKERFSRLKRLHARAHSNPVSAIITKVIVTIVGVLIILAGIVMLIGPGQGILAIIAGLAVLSSEYVWAQRLLKRAQAKWDEARDKARAMDPRVRRRRIALVTFATVAVCGAVVAYLVVYDWPAFTVTGWNWVQSISGLVPELPGM
jgi:uncharacterized protein (TIGR02611 family)